MHNTRFPVLEVPRLSPGWTDSSPQKSAPHSPVDSQALSIHASRCSVFSSHKFFLLFQAAFSDKVCIDEARLYMGEWGAAFGRQEAVHSGEFMGIPPTGKKVNIRYMDFWKVVDGKIVDNYVSGVCSQ